jgi:hypothetical protein
MRLGSVLYMMNKQAMTLWLFFSLRLSGKGEFVPRPNHEKTKRKLTMKIKNVFAAASASMILLLLAACNMPQPTAAPMQTPTEVVMPATGVDYTFVTNKLLMPTTQEQTQAFALNVDGDAGQTLDNKFGSLLTLLTSAVKNIELQSTLDQAVNNGQLVSLHAVKADDAMNDTSVSWSILHGQKTLSAPVFDGSDKFALDSVEPVNLPIVGSLTNGHFSGGPGAAKIQMYLLGQPLDVDLIGLRLESDVSAEGCVNGKLGGAVSVEEFRGKVLPPIADGLNLVIKSDQTAATAILQAFDSDSNGEITSQELENNPLLMIAISPDVDMLDASGNFNPRQDGVNDSYSMGLGFTCVPATW